MVPLGDAHAHWTSNACPQENEEAGDTGLWCYKGGKIFIYSSRFLLTGLIICCKTVKEKSNEI